MNGLKIWGKRFLSITTWEFWPSPQTETWKSYGYHTFYITGICKTNPRPYYKFWAVHGKYLGREFPVIMCLSTGKTVGQYKFCKRSKERFCNWFAIGFSQDLEFQNLKYANDYNGYQISQWPVIRCYCSSVQKEVSLCLTPHQHLDVCRKKTAVM